MKRWLKLMWMIEDMLDKRWSPWADVFYLHIIAPYVGMAPPR